MSTFSMAEVEKFTLLLSRTVDRVSKIRFAPSIRAAALKQCELLQVVVVELQPPQFLDQAFAKDQCIRNVLLVSVSSNSLVAEPPQPRTTRRHCAPTWQTPT